MQKMTSGAATEACCGGSSMYSLKDVCGTSSLSMRHVLSTPQNSHVQCEISSEDDSAMGGARSTLLK